ncbi:MAG TPA: hypothetical protein VGS15_06965 [Candidatus Acidoferrales bacterium]|nr:hypothetical protein [Candidatus Acidoferrales bacterium]HEV2341519.1 hypothetical protein [Candidatus Acidoferrales bacterium]
MTQKKMQEDLVVARTYSYRHEAEIGRTMLEANGVDAMIVADDFGGMQPAVGADTGVKLLVKREDEDAAKKLLE